MQAIFENLPLWWQGMGMTLLLTGVVTLIGLPIGILLAGMRVSPVAALRVVAAVWTEVALFIRVDSSCVALFMPVVLMFVSLTEF